MENPELAHVEAVTRAWTREIVVGMNLCPFAKAPFEQGKVKIVVCGAKDRQEAYRAYLGELEFLANRTDEVTETTLIVYPNQFSDFDDYLDFIDLAESCIEEADLEGVVQVASFHPRYQFEDTAPDDVTNFTNRSPYPVVHLLLEDSVTWAVENHPDVEGIPTRNILKMRELGLERMEELMNSIRLGAKPNP
jgi:hypothetical protein